MPPKHFGGTADSRKYAPEKIQGDNSHFSYAPEKNIFFAKFCFFLLLCPKRPSPFSYIYPTKNPLLNDKV